MVHLTCSMKGEGQTLRCPDLRLVCQVTKVMSSSDRDLTATLCLCLQEIRQIVPFTAIWEDRDWEMQKEMERESQHKCLSVTGARSKQLSPVIRSQAQNRASYTHRDTHIHTSTGLLLLYNNTRTSNSLNQGTLKHKAQLGGRAGHQNSWPWVPECTHFSPSNTSIIKLTSAESNVCVHFGRATHSQARSTGNSIRQSLYWNWN